MYRKKAKVSDLKIHFSTKDRILIAKKRIFNFLKEAQIPIFSLVLVVAFSLFVFFAISRIDEKIFCRDLIENHTNNIKRNISDINCPNKNEHGKLLYCKIFTYNGLKTLIGYNSCHEHKALEHSGEFDKVLDTAKKLNCPVELVF